MSFWPRRRTTVRCDLPPHALVRRLEELVGPPPIARVKIDAPPEPHVGDRGGRIAFSGFTGGMNPFAPTVQGVVTAEPHGSRLEAELLPSRAGAALGIGLVGGFGFLAYVEYGNAAEPGAWAKALVFSALVAVWMAAGYVGGCKSAQVALERLGDRVAEP